MKLSVYSCEEHGSRLLTPPCVIFMNDLNLSDNPCPEAASRDYTEPNMGSKGCYKCSDERTKDET